MPPTRSPTTAEFLTIANPTGRKGGRAPASIAEKLAKLGADKTLDVSGYAAEGKSRVIASPKSAALTRVNSKGHSVVVPRKKFGTIGQIVSDNAESYAMAMYELNPSRSYAQYEREWNDMFRAHQAATMQSKAATEQRKAERIATRPATGAKRGRPVGSKNKPKLAPATGYVGRPNVAAAMEQRAVAEVETDVANALLRSASAHRSASRVASPRPASRVASPRSASQVLRVASPVASPRMSPSMMRAAGL